MQTTTEIMAKRVRAINQLALDINEAHDDDLTIESKYHDIMYFVCEMMRTAAGIADLDDEVMTYGCWE